MLFFNFYSYCQSWEKIPLDNYFNIDEIAMSPSGEMYILIEGKNTIMQSKDSGQTWKNIIPDSSYNVNTWTNKTLTAPLDSLVYLFYNVIKYPYKFDGDKFIQLKTIFNYYLKLKANETGQLFSRNYATFIKTNYDLSLKDTLFKEWIEDFFVYDEENNFVITKDSHQPSKYSTIQVNSTSKQNNLLYQYDITNVQKIFVDKNGSTFIATYDQLYRIDKNEPTILKSLNFNKNGGQAKISKFVITYGGEYIVISDSKAYYSKNSGESWHLLYSLSKNLPSDITEIILKDSINGIVKFKQNCFDHASIINQKVKQWYKPNIDLSLPNITQIIETGDNSLLLYYNCNWWKLGNNLQQSQIQINNNQVQNIIQLKNGKLIANTIIGLYSSIDNAMSWQEITTDLFTTNKSITNIYADQSDRVYILAKKNNTINNFSIYHSDIGGLRFDDVNISMPNIYTICQNSKGFPLVLSSYNILYKSIDLGKTWSATNVLKDYSIDQIIQVHDDTILFNGTKSNNFELYSLSNFSNIELRYNFGSRISGIVFNIQYPRIGVNNTGRLIQISEDGGKSWIDNTGNLPYTYSDVKWRWIQAQNIAADHDWYVYIAHKGLFKTKNLFTRLHNEIPKEKNILIYPTLANDYIKIQCSTQSILPQKIFIYNSQGQEILSKILTQLEEEINIDMLSSGFYIITMIDKYKMLYSNYFIKK